MSVPKPPVELKDHCTVIHDGTLYVYMPENFLSLSLKEGGKWKKLDMGQSVTGAACFEGDIDGNPSDPGFYVVGGSGSAPDYQGIQGYSFSSKKWKSMIADGPDIANRINHAAIYLKTSSSILVFAGSQDGNPNPSTQTFVISTTASPYHIESFNSQVAPSYDPFLLPWNDESAVMIGGGPQNINAYTFNGREGWRDTGRRLFAPLGDKSVTKASILSTTDYKMLEVFDFSESPIKIRRQKLNGVNDGSAQTPARRDLNQFNHGTRDVAISNVPYNNTLAPSKIDAGSSLAQGSDGMIVISGPGQQSPINIFDSMKNEWVNTADMFGKSQILSVSSSSTASPTTTSLLSTSTISPTTSTTTTPSSSAAAAASGGTKSNTMTIVGATLGAVLGIFALILLVLLYLAWRKRGTKYGQSNTAYDKDRLSFQDQGMEPLTRSIQPMGRGPVPSADSWAMVSKQADGNGFPKAVLPSSRDLSTSEDGRSPLRNMETSQLGNNKTISPVPRKRDDKPASNVSIPDSRLTDIGWSKYFEADNKAPKKPSSTASSGVTASDYRGSAWAPAIGIPAINTQPLGKVSSGSPSTEHPPQWGDSHVAHHGMSAKIESGDSSSISSVDSHEKAEEKFSSGVPTSIFEGDNWATGRSNLANGRAPSSNYSGSIFLDSNVSTARNTERGANRAPTDLSSDISWLNIGRNKK